MIIIVYCAKLYTVRIASHEQKNFQISNILYLYVRHLFSKLHSDQRQNIIFLKI